jgi:hypothetical protein
MTYCLAESSSCATRASPEQSEPLTGNERTRLKHASTTANLKRFLEYALELVDSRNIDWHDQDVVL